MDSWTQSAWVFAAEGEEARERGCVTTACPQPCGSGKIRRRRPAAVREGYAC